VFLLASLSSNLRAKVKLLLIALIGVEFHRTQLTRIHHVSNDVHCRTRKRQQLTSASSFRGRREKGSKRWVVTVRALELSQCSPLTSISGPFQMVPSFGPCTCAHVWSFARIYRRAMTSLPPTNGHISNYLPGPDNTLFSISNRPSSCLFFVSQRSFVLSRIQNFKCKVHFRFH